MKIPTTLNAIGALLGAALLLTGPAGAQDHAHHHDHGGGVPEMDAEGKRLESYDVRHDMTPEQLAGLRKKVALYRGFTDREVNMNMSGMGPNYAWYVSDLGLEGKVGVLLLAHGVGENSDRLFKGAVEPLAENQPTAIGYGMAMMTSNYLQAAVDDLVARGAETIVLVPTGATTEHNTLTRQWKYIFGLHDESSYLDVERVTAEGVRFVFTDHLSDHPLITEALYDHAKTQSKNPSNEVLIIVGHGPEDVEDNIPDLEILGAHVERIKAKNEFADVRLINLQDDAIPPLRETNVRKLRRWIKMADRKGQDVIVVAIAAASHGVQAHIKSDLRGLKYRFAEQGLSEHPNYIKWIESTINKTVAQLD